MNLPEGVALSARSGVGGTGRVAREGLTLRFEGDSVVDGTISARAMAVALEGVADLVQAVSKVGEFKEHAAPEARVVATEEGSFLLEIDIVAVGEWWAAIRSAMAGEDATAVANVAAFTAVAAGAMKWFKERGSQKIATVQATDEGLAEVTLEDGQTDVVEPEVAEAITSPRVQAAAKRVVEPLSFVGINGLTINAETVNVTIQSGEAERFPAPAAEEDPTRKVETFDVWATFNRPDFGGDKWGVATTRDSFQAVILDDVFLARVDDGSVSLSKYDEFRITVRKDPYITKGGQRRYRRYVTKVHDQRGGHEHPEGLPIETGEGEG